MNTLLFLGGAGAGALVAVFSFIFVMSRTKGGGDVSDKLLRFNQLNLEALCKRNDIGERQAKSLEALESLVRSIRKFS